MGVAYNPTWNIKQSLRISPNSVSPRLLIQAESGSFEATNQNRRQFISANGITLVNANAPRSYLITQLRNINGAWVLIASAGYDVYGNTTAAGQARTFLQSFLMYDMLVLNTWDEPLTNAASFLYPTLISDFGSQVSTFTRSFRDMYLLISVKGKGVIYEEHRPRFSDSIHFSGWLL